MKKLLLYSSGNIIDEKPTGGEYRFLELAHFLQNRKGKEAEPLKSETGQNFTSFLCCADAEAALKTEGLQADIRLSPPDTSRSFLPAEASILLRNRKTIREIAKSDFDAVIAFDVPPAIGLTLCGVKNLILMIRKDLIGYEKVKAGNSLRRALVIAYQFLCESICLRHAKKVICQCEYDREVLVRRHPLLRRRLTEKTGVQINNADPSWIVKHSEAAEPEPHTAETFRVCFIGGFSDLRKGQELFLNAAKSLSEKYSDLEFVLVGGGKHLEEYRARYENRQISFRGRMENPNSVLKSADLLVVPSLADSCPNTVMEALYNHIPVIGSRAGGIPEILENERALFDLTAESLSAKIESLYQNADELSALKKRQQTRLTELTFNWPEKILELIWN